MNHHPRKIVLAYSGGLDTSVILTWLKEEYGADVVACYINLGQKENVKAIEKKAYKTGAVAFYAPDVKKEYVTEYLWPALQAHATYEKKYLLGTALARPLMAKKIVEIARKVNADAVAHGATGKGNDQVRFELTFGALAPDLKIMAPWRTWSFKGREDLLAYAAQHGIQVPVSKKRPYSSDENIWHISHEGGILEDLDKPVPKDVYQWTTAPEEAPAKPRDLTLEFVRGVPVRINGRNVGPVEMVETLNKIGGQHAIGRIDLVENRLVGLKSRGIYECPAATLLYAAHQELESLVLDRETLHAKEAVGPKIGELTYYGQWFSSLRKSYQAFVSSTQTYVTGWVKFRLYKGSLMIRGRSAKQGLYSKDWVTFEADSLYNQSDATGFIRLYGLPLKMESLLRKKWNPPD